jgi:hypothetical protein
MPAAASAVTLAIAGCNANDSQSSHLGCGADSTFSRGLARDAAVAVTAAADAAAAFAALKHASETSP